MNRNSAFKSTLIFVSLLLSMHLIAAESSSQRVEKLEREFESVILSSPFLPALNNSVRIESNAIGQPITSFYNYSDQAYQNTQDKFESFANKAKKLLTKDSSAQVNLLELKLRAHQLSEQAKFPHYLFPLGPYRNDVVTVFQLASGQSVSVFNDSVTIPFDSISAYEQWLETIKTYPDFIDNVILNLKYGVENGFVMSRLLTEEKIKQLNQLQVEEYENSLFYKPITEMPSFFLANQKQYLILQYSKVIRAKVIPATQKLIDFLEGDYLPKTKDVMSIYQVPFGESLYFSQLMTETLSEQSTENIQILAYQKLQSSYSKLKTLLLKDELESQSEESNNVSAIDKSKPDISNDLQMDISKVDAKRFWQELHQSQFDAQTNNSERLDAVVKQINRASTELFDYFPTHTYQVSLIESQQSLPFAYIEVGIKELKPARVVVNKLHPLTSNPYFMPMKLVEFGAPGQHFYQSFRNENSEEPVYKVHLNLKSNELAWRKYSRELLLSKPFISDKNRIGASVEELWMATRLFVDVSLHHKEWSKESLIRILQQNTPFNKSELEMLILQSVNNPGVMSQEALRFFNLMQLLENAQRDFGEPFNWKKFNVIVLSHSTKPLEITEGVLRRWTATQVKRKDE
ncbi:MAG: DUF885 family protein [Gammaproteobacteria bacterium]|nr:DUF885 family protein [Gammaproteobacteria bacterium]